MGLSSAQKAACGKLALIWSWEQRLRSSTWEAQVKQEPCGKLSKGEPKEWRLEEVWEAQPRFGQKVSNIRRKGSGSLPVQSALHGG